MKVSLNCLKLSGYLLLATILLTNCKKDGNRIRIQGFFLTNPNGDNYGQQGPADDDWTIQAGSPDKDITALFDFSATIDMSDVVECDLTTRVNTYPNPTVNNQFYEFRSTGTALLKLVIVDQKLRIVHKQAVKLKKGGNILVTNLQDRSIFPAKGEFRVYYSLSTSNKPNYKYGYGDIKICEDGLGDCFK